MTNVKEESQISMQVTNNSPDFDEYKEISNWFLIIEFVGLSGLAIYNYLEIRKHININQNKKQKLETYEYKQSYLSYLCYAAIIRCLSLFVIIFIDYEPDGLSSLLFYMLYTLPGLMWGPAYFSLALFFAHLYYISQNIISSYIHPYTAKSITLLLIIMNFVIIVDALDSKQYIYFFNFSIFINLLTFLVTGILIGYFGISLSGIVQEIGQQEAQSLSEMMNKIKCLTLILGGLFSLRVFYYYLLFFHSNGMLPYNNIFLIDVFITEILPYVACLVIKIKKQSIDASYYESSIEIKDKNTQSLLEPDNL